LADPRVIFKEALLEQATCLIMAHNHPSGNPNPSPEDDRLTKKVAEAGAVMDIQLNDHIIFTDKGYYSYKDANRL
jgi:DNA repair protein RadC